MPFAGNCFGGAKQTDDRRLQEPPLCIDGDGARWDHREGNEDYSRAGDIFFPMAPEKQRELVDNIVAAMRGIAPDIQVRQIGRFSKADTAYPTGVARGLGSDLAQVQAAA